MAAETQTGKDRAEMKRFLIKSKQEPVNCAIGVGDDKSVALLMLARNRSPKALQGDLQKEFPSACNTRFGTAVVDTDDDPTLVKFMLNKAVTSMARRLVKTLKGTGFRKVQILLEDGSPVEIAAEEEATEQANAEGGATVAPPRPDASALAQALTALVARIAEVTDPARKEALAKLARDANVNIKTGNLTYAATNIELLRRALDAAPAADGTDPTSQQEPPPPPSAPPAAEVKPDVTPLIAALTALPVVSPSSPIPRARRHWPNRRARSMSTSRPATWPMPPSGSKHCAPRWTLPQLPTVQATRKRFARKHLMCKKCWPGSTRRRPPLTTKSRNCSASCVAAPTPICSASANSV